MSTSAGDNKELVHTIVELYQENQSYQLNENQELRSSLETIQKELHFNERAKRLRDKKLQQSSIHHFIELIEQFFDAPFQSIRVDFMENYI